MTGAYEVLGLHMAPGNSSELHVGTGIAYSTVQIESSVILMPVIFHCLSTLKLELIHKKKS